MHHFYNYTATPFILMGKKMNSEYSKSSDILFSIHRKTAMLPKQNGNKVTP
jgi:hypothetical protein